MKSFLKYTVTGAVLSLSATATDLTLSSAGSEPITRHTVKLQCDDHAVALGLPIKERSLVFTNVMSGSGAHYAAGPYIWWKAGARRITLSANPDSLDDQQQTACQTVK